MSNQVFLAAIKIVPIEFFFAILLEIFIVGPLVEKTAFKLVNPKKDHPVIITTIIICYTVAYMCPMMSFISTLLFNGLNTEFIAKWLQNIVLNLPFAFFTQIFFVQPFVR